jgi:hypothetical protein
VHRFYCHCFLFRSTSKIMSDENRPNHSDHSVQQHSTASNVLSNLLSSFTWAFERPHIDYPAPVKEDIVGNVINTRSRANSASAQPTLINAATPLYPIDMHAVESRRSDADDAISKAIRKHRNQQHHQQQHRAHDEPVLHPHAIQSGTSTDSVRAHPRDSFFVDSDTSLLMETVGSRGSQQHASANTRPSGTTVTAIDVDTPSVWLASRATGIGGPGADRTTSTRPQLRSTMPQTEDRKHARASPLKPYQGAIEPLRTGTESHLFAAAPVALVSTSPARKKSRTTEPHNRGVAPLHSIHQSTLPPPSPPLASGLSRGTMIQRNQPIVVLSDDDDDDEDDDDGRGDFELAMSATMDDVQNHVRLRHPVSGAVVTWPLLDDAEVFADFADDDSMKAFHKPPKIPEIDNDMYTTRDQMKAALRAAMKTTVKANAELQQKQV